MKIKEAYEILLSAPESEQQRIEREEKMAQDFKWAYDKASFDKLRAERRKLHEDQRKAKKAAKEREEHRRRELERRRNIGYYDIEATIKELRDYEIRQSI